MSAGQGLRRGSYTFAPIPGGAVPPRVHQPASHHLWLFGVIVVAAALDIGTYTVLALMTGLR